MLFGSQSHDEYPQELDEHNAPTEPLNTFPLLSHPVGISAGEPSVLDDIIPAPTPLERPFPALDHTQANPYSPYPHPPVSPVYPFLPPLPSTAKNKKGHRSAGGAQLVFPVSPDYPVAPPKPVKKKRAKPSAIPVFVGIFFVTVQLLLLVRFFLKLFESRSNVPWVAFLYAVSNIFALPFRLILQNFPLPIPASLELYTLLAILVYGLLSRILVRILKAILR